jgi:hypothetical protein
MSLFGTLPEIPLCDLLQLLAASHKTGRLQVVQNKRATNVYFRDGRVVACSADDPAKLLGQFLLYLGVITEDVLRTAMNVQSTTGESLRTILVSMQRVTEEELSRIVQAKAEETLHGLFDLGEATFSFSDNLAPGPTDTAVAFDVADIAVQGIQRAADRSRIRQTLGDPGTVLRHTDRPIPSRSLDDWPTRQIYKAVDGARTVGEIVLHVHGSEFLVMRCLCWLHQEGFAEVVGSRGAAVATAASSGQAPGERPGMIEPAAAHRRLQAGEGDNDVDRARALVADGDPEAALELLGEAHRADPSDSAIRKLAVQAERLLLEQLMQGGLSPGRVPVLAVSRSELQKHSFAPAEEFILNLSDGSWDVRALTWVSPMRAVEVASILRGLIDRGFVRLRS